VWRHWVAGWLTIVVIAGCGGHVGDVASLQELMRDQVDASADAIWDAVGTTTTRDGIVEKQPRSDADWKALRRHAVVLLEATHLLVIPGRRVAAKEFPSDGPGVFSSQEIQAELGRRQREFAGFAQGLRASGRRVLAAIDSRDVDALLKEGAVMDDACEACHRSFWYPHEVVPALPAEPPRLQDGPAGAGAIRAAVGRGFHPACVVRCGR